MQGQGLRDRFDRFQSADCVVLGASFDTPAENKAFADEQQFPFRLLSDVDRRAGAAYQVLKEPGEKNAEFAQRIAYLMDPDGEIRRSYQVSDVAGFAEVVLDDLGRLQQP